MDNPKIRYTFSLGDVKCTILAPNSESYEDLNNYSVVIRLTYGTTKFILQGDGKDISFNTNPEDNNSNSGSSKTKPSILSISVKLPINDINHNK